ncbi:MAG: hypothetical protein HC925_00815 [Coleofasciculaceae cyanobacterium SM2_3_26]|nr:hypothetical protein [Coleofasciculaceae cyanobacterium SM2_3_26]
MNPVTEPVAWEVALEQQYVPLLHEGNMVGFCTPTYAKEIAEALNEEDRVRKALRMACLDLLRRVGGDTSRVGELMERYIERAQRPKFGPRAIAAMLSDRQRDLQLSNQEFVKFCDTYKVSPRELKSIYAGENIDRRLIAPIARILGIAPADVLDILEGTASANDG